MNPAAPRVNLRDLKIGGMLVVNTGAFTAGNLKKAGYDVSPLDDESLGAYRLLKIDVSKLTLQAVAPFQLGTIKQWGRKNPSQLPELLKQNARYVFFRELPADISGPIGALGVPLTAGRSIAIDPLSVPQGAPVFLATTWPNTNRPLNRLMVAQDVGSAIIGGVRADFFWGFGEEAATQAGKMKQSGKMWVLMPKSYLSTSKQ